MHDLFEVDWVGARPFEVHDCNLADVEGGVVELSDEELDCPVGEIGRLVQQAAKVMRSEQACLLEELASADIGELTM